MKIVTLGAILASCSRRSRDSLWYGKGQLAVSNADQVRRIRRILEELSIEINSGRGARDARDQGRRQSEFQGATMFPDRSSKSAQLFQRGGSPAGAALRVTRSCFRRT
jgi:hypothetical protein